MIMHTRKVLHELSLQDHVPPCKTTIGGQAKLGVGRIESGRSQTFFLHLISFLSLSLSM